MNPLNGLFDDPADPECIFRCIGGIAQGLFRCKSGPAFVFSESVFHGDCMGRWDNAICLKSVELFNVVENGIHLSGQRVKLGLTQAQAGQATDVLNFFTADFHFPVNLHGLISSKKQIRKLARGAMARQALPALICHLEVFYDTLEKELH
jgi:hypothetical protein